MAIGNMHRKIGKDRACVPEISWWTDRHTDRCAHRNTLAPLLRMGEVTMYDVPIKFGILLFLFVFTNYSKQPTIILSPPSKFYEY